MDTKTETKGTDSSAEDQAVKNTLPTGAPEGLVKAAQGKDVTGDEERDVIDFLLGKQAAPRYKVEVKFDTPKGTRELVWTLRALDGRRIFALEKEYTKTGSGVPYGDLDDIAFNAALVAEATVEIASPSGRKVDIKSDEFRAGCASPVDALMQRFHYQSGVLAGLAGQVREISGWSPDRIGSAQRVITTAVGNS